MKYTSRFKEISQPIVSFSELVCRNLCIVTFISPCCKKYVFLHSIIDKNFNMKIITQPINHSDLSAMLPGYFGNMIKAVVDVKQGILGLDAELHADIEKEMLTQGSKQSDLWGINLYPEMDSEDFIEFDSLINIRPYQSNRSRDVEDPETRKRIIDIVQSLIQ